MAKSSRKRRRKPPAAAAAVPPSPARASAVPPGAAARRKAAIRLDAERQRRVAGRRRLRRLIILAGTVAAIAILVVLEVFIHRLNGEERRLLAAAPAAARSAGCGPVSDVGPYRPESLDRIHIGAPDARKMPALSTYPSIPPASGPHDPTPIGAGVYTTPPPLGRAIHSLEHAAVIVWYDPSRASASEVKRIQDFFRRGEEKNHVIVAPYQYPGFGADGSLPTGQSMALVAWHHLQACSEASLPVAFSFVHDYRFNIYQWGAYKGDAPEKFSPI